MTKKEYILFDLDGTVTDPKEGITKSVSYALRAFGIIENDLDKLTRFIGPPLRDSFMNHYGFTSGNIESVIEKYREYYSVTGIYQNLLYDGIEGLFRGLKSRGKTIALATSKATVYAKQILRHFGINGYFTFVAGSELDGGRSKKAEVVRFALDGLGISAEQAVMVGDREHDVFGAKENGVACVGVLYGYGDRPELEAAGADMIADDIAALHNILM